MAAAFPKLEGYVVTERIGSGAYSTVYKAYTKVGARCAVAVKAVPRERVRGAGAADNLLREIRLLQQLRHPHILQLRHFSWDRQNIYLVTEWCAGGDLAALLRRAGRVRAERLRRWLQQLASALRYLRERGVAHLDLKPHNLLLQREPRAPGGDALRLADFGFAAQLPLEAALGARGSPLYMAPEMLRAGGAYDARADLWSVGVIMYECLFGRAPYSSRSLPELLRKVDSRQPIQIPTWAGVPQPCRELLSALLRHDPDQRISYEEFFAHPYLDLQHMPTRENYDKALALVRRAAALDAAGDARDAFAAYRAALRYLLPCARAEPDAARRSALHAKLDSYMRRAEELQLQLFGPEPPATPTPTTTPPATPTPTPPATPTPAPASAAWCCSAGGATVSAHEQEPPAPPAAPRTPPQTGDPAPARDACRIA